MRRHAPHLKVVAACLYPLGHKLLIGLPSRLMCLFTCQGRQQQDSHEILHLLLDGLRGEELRSRQLAVQQQQLLLSVHTRGMGTAPGKGPVPQSVPTSTSSAEEASLISRVFGGRLASTLSCRTCGYSSVSLP